MKRMRYLFGGASALILAIVGGAWLTLSGPDTRGLDPCLYRLVTDLEKTQGSRVLWSWTAEGASDPLAEARRHFKQADNTFCYLLTFRSNAQHLLCGTGSPFEEAKFLYRLHGLDDSVVDKCSSARPR
jgi:hypothetical protein